MGALLRAPSLVFGAAVFLSSVSLLNASEDFANCRNASKQLKFTNEAAPNELKVQAASVLISEMEELLPMFEKNTTDMPQKLLQLCFETKHKAFENLFLNGNEALFETFDFLMAAGKFFFFDKNWDLSHKSFDKAAKQKSNLFEPSFYALRSWVVLQATSEKPLPQDVYLRKAREYYKSIVKAKDSTKFRQKLGTETLAYLENYSQNVYSARANFKTAANMEPKNLELRLRWGFFEEGAGRFDDAIKIYEDALALNIVHPVFSKEISIRVLKLYELQGYTQKHGNRLAQVKKDFPNDPEVIGLQALRSPASK